MSQSDRSVSERVKYEPYDSKVSVEYDKKENKGMFIKFVCNQIVLLMVNL